MKIKVLTADYSRSFNPDTSNNGGGYWQYNGTAEVTLEDGTVFAADADDGSCGDYGERYGVALVSGGERYTFAVNYVDSDGESYSNSDDAFFAAHDEQLRDVAIAVLDALNERAYAMWRADHA